MKIFVETVGITVGARLVVERCEHRLGFIDIPLETAAVIAAECPREVESFACPRCGASVRRDEISLHPAHEQAPPWNSGFEWCGSCPSCEAKRREADRCPTS